MGISFANLKRRAPVLALAAVVVVAVVGVIAFFLAMRPCLLDLPPGMIARYSLVTEYRAWPPPEPISMEVDGKTIKKRPHWPVLRSDDQQVVLIGLDEGGGAALIGSDKDARRPELHQVHLAPDGIVRRRDGQVLHDTGPTIGFFDFNLLPLPEGLAQHWQTSLLYAYPPVSKRQQTARVRRTHNGVRPRFRMKIPTVEWVDAAPPGAGPEFNERYVQIKDLEAAYQFDTTRGLVDDARITFVAGAETEGSYARYQVTMRLTLDQLQRAEDSIADLNASVNRIVQAQEAVSSGASEQLGSLANQLLATPIQTHELSELAAGLAQQSRGVQSHSEGWAVQVASVSHSRAPEAERLRLGVVADGYPAYIRESGTFLIVCAGPFSDKDERVLADLRRRYPRNEPFWVEVRQ